MLREKEKQWIAERTWADGNVSTRMDGWQWQKKGDGGDDDRTNEQLNTAQAYSWNGGTEGWRTCELWVRHCDRQAPMKRNDIFGCQ